MLSIKGSYFDGNDSKAYPAHLEVEGLKVTLILDSGHTSSTAKVASSLDLNISDRVGNTLRRIYFPDESCFETRDNDLVDQAFPESQGWLAHVHFLESHGRSAAIMLAVLVFIAFILHVYVIPAGAQTLAQVTPQYLKEALDDSFGQSFEALSIMSETELELPRKQAMQELFDELKGEFPELHLKPRLIAGSVFGANAFALPGGTIYVTDELVQLAEDDTEILAVLYHEVAHTQLNHGLQAVIRRAGLSLLLLTVVGAEDIASLPMLLVTSAYSRESEREADFFAAKKLRQRGIKPSVLGDFLLRISKSEEEGTSILSSHPLSAERAKYLREL